MGFRNKNQFPVEPYSHVWSRFKPTTWMFRRKRLERKDNLIRNIFTGLIQIIFLISNCNPCINFMLHSTGL